MFEGVDYIHIFENYNELAVCDIWIKEWLRVHM